MENQKQPESMHSILQKTNFNQLQRTSETIQISSDEISIYGKGQISESVSIEETKKILIAFPKIEAQMIKLLRDRFKANGFTDMRMTDAINFVIDTYSGFDKLPAIGDFISFDRKVKTYTISELQMKYKDSYYFGATYDPIAMEYSRIDVEGEMRLVKKEDAKKYNLKLWENKNKRR